MPTGSVNAFEKTLRQVLLPLFVFSGVIVLAGFFFQGMVVSVLTGQGWLVVALLFFGTGLGYVSLLPVHDDETEESRHQALGAQYLLRIRRLTWLNSMRDFFVRQDTVTFWVPVVVFVGFVFAQVLAPSATLSTVNTLRGVILNDLGLVFLVAMFVAVAYCLFLLVGPWGEVKLGGPDAEPAYTYPTYFSMVFTAGIAAGIVFWGPGESIFHYQTPPPYFGAEAGTGGAVVPALTYALFHWGFSAWSAYAAIGIPIAYFVYQRGAPLRVSTLLLPFLGMENLDSHWAKLVDMLAIFATLGGLATSVSQVGQQFLTGINYQWGVTYGTIGPLLFIAGLSIIYIISAESGVHRGIRRIAGINVVLFALFGLFLLAVGPRSFIFDNGAAALGSYAVNFVPMSFYLGGAGTWVADWTVWNWSWWFSWAPFAGLFIAALSRGRRIRTVVLTSVVATSAATMVWFLLFGGTALQLQISGAADILGSVSAYGGTVAVAGFPILSALPVSQLLIFLFLALIIVFITTSADTSTLVVSILATRRDVAPTTGSIVFWGLFQGAVALSVFVVGGADALQSLAVLTGGPFAIITLVALAGLTRAFRREERGHTSPLVRGYSKLMGSVETPDDLNPETDD